MAVITNLELDHHATLELARGAAGGLRRLRRARGRPGLRRRRAACPGRRHSVSSASPWSPAAVSRRRTPSCSRPRSGPSRAGGSRFRARGAGIDAEVELPVPGPPQRRQRARGARRAVAGRLRRGGLRAGARGFPGVARRLELKGERNGARIYDDYAHHPTEVRPRSRRPASSRPQPPDRRLPAAPLLAHQGAGTRVRRRPRGGRRGGGARRLPGARGAGGPAPGVSGLMVAEAAADAAGGRPVWWLPTAELAPRRPSRPQLRRGRPAGDDRRRGHRPARRGAWRTAVRSERARRASSATTRSPG